MDAHDLFEILVRDHASMLSAYLRCIVHSPAEVDDLFQETLVVAWRNLEKFDRSRPFGPWLRGIAGNLVLEHQRKTARAGVTCEPALLEQLELRFWQLQQQRGDTLDEKLAGLRACLRELPEPYREAVRLRYQEDLAGLALAERLQITLENMKKRLQRGREWLLHCLTAKLKSAEGST